MAVNHGQRFHSPTFFDTSNVLVKTTLFCAPGRIRTSVFGLGRLDSPGQLASVLPEAASDVRHGAQIAPGAPMAEFWPKYANLMNWGDPPACGIPP